MLLGFGPLVLVVEKTRVESGGWCRVGKVRDSVVCATR